MNKLRIVAVLAPLGLAAMGCDSSGIPLDQMAAQTASAYCTKLYECCVNGEIDGGLFGPDQATCETNIRAQQNTKRGQINEGQNAGRLAYHGDRMAQCLSELRQTSCQDMKSNLTSRLAMCQLYLEPRVDAGNLCGQNEECINGRCLADPAVTDGGRCVTFVGQGASCATAPCGEQLYCRSSSQTCEHQKVDGDTCTLNGECATGGCNVDAGTGTCGLKGGSGSMCFNTTGCGATGSEAVGPLGAALAALVLIALGRRARAQAR